MTRTVDLNARRAARAEHQGERPTITVGDETFQLPHSVPIAFVEYGTAGEMRKACALLVGEDNVDRFLSYGIDSDDLTDIISGAYGTEPGESQASTSS